MQTSATRSSITLAFMLVLSAGVVWAAPSLPIHKPPVQPINSGSGPANDPNAIQGQWFQVIASQELTVRTHEFHDNTQGDGGGSQGHLAIAGWVTNVVLVSGPQGSRIQAFDIDAVVCNDTPGTGSWQSGTNGHFEFQTATSQATGTLQQAILTADFAVMTSDPEIPVIPPYRWVSPQIVATNMDVLGWFCWTEDGDFTVPGWTFGDIEPGQSKTQRLNFVVSGAGLSPSETDLRYQAIMQSWTEGTDLFLNRSSSLKISDWINDLGVDTGEAYPTSSLASSDVSVFHNAIETTVSTPITITDIRRPVGAGTTVASVGDGGTGAQVLQAATDLAISNWVDVVTNPLPLAAPQTNFWIDTPTVEITRFYRVLQK